MAIAAAKARKSALAGESGARECAVPQLQLPDAPVRTSPVTETILA
jgi:hypothetical protein